MQALQEETRSLRRAIRYWLQRAGWLRDARSEVGEKHAQDLSLPSTAASDILDRAAADLRRLSSKRANEDDDGVDARHIIERTVRDLSRLGFHCRPFEAAIMEHYLQQLPKRDYQILRYFKQGRKHHEIATAMGMDVNSVRRSLVKTYAELRIRMINSHDDGGGGLPAIEQLSQRSFDEPMRQTALRHH